MKESYYVFLFPSQRLLVHGNVYYNHILAIYIYRTWTDPNKFETLQLRQPILLTALLTTVDKKTKLDLVLKPFQNPNKFSVNKALRVGRNSSFMFIGMSTQLEYEMEKVLKEEYTEQSCQYRNKRAERIPIQQWKFV